MPKHDGSKRRNVLKSIGVGSALGLGLISGPVSAAGGNGNQSSGSPAGPLDLNFNPHDRTEMIGFIRAYKSMSPQARERVLHRLSETQVAAFADAHRVSYVTSIEYIAESIDDRPSPGTRETGQGSAQKTEILSQDTVQIRSDIGKKWGWSE